VTRGKHGWWRIKTATRRERRKKKKEKKKTLEKQEKGNET